MLFFETMLWHLSFDYDKRLKNSIIGLAAFIRVFTHCTRVASGRLNDDLSSALSSVEKVNFEF